MTDFSTLWQQARTEPAKENVYADVPPGVYSCFVREASLDLAADKVSFHFEITTEGAYLKRRLFSNYHLTSSVGMKMLDETLSKLGVEQSKLDAIANHDQLAAILNSVLSLSCQVTAKLGQMKSDGSGNWLNVYVNSANVAAPKSSAAVSAVPKLDSSDEIPF